MFNHIEQGRRLKKDDQKSGNIPFVMSGITNTGIVGYISNPVASFPANSITVDIFGNTFYRNYDFGAGDDTGVYWNDKISYSENAMLFFAIAIQNALKGKFSYGNKLRSSQSFDLTIQLPLKENALAFSNPCDDIENIDFDFMEAFIRELEEERIRELEEERIRELNAYLLATGLKDYELTAEEENALKAFETMEWREFAFKEIFNKIIQGRRLKKEDQKEGSIPFVMSGTTNTGVVGYISNPVASFPANSITVDIFGNTFYRNYSFGAGDDTGVYWNDEISYSENQMLFYTTAMGKSVSGKFDFGNKLRSSQSYDIRMFLPTKDGLPDYASMETFIKAVEKLVIKDVVLYADKKISATKSVVGEE